MYYKISFLYCCILVSLVLFSCTSKTNDIPKVDLKKQEAIINEHLVNDAWQYSLYSKERQTAIDKGLAKDSTIAYLWQQKAMPLFKQRKYELGLAFLNKAVKFDRASWQEYRAFMQCIFMKNYQNALDDFQDCKKRFGNHYVMDHSYDFYSALCHLQLNQFKAAETLLQKEVQKQLDEHGEDWVHYLDIFYLGISQYELEQYKTATTTFDTVLKLYPNFAEAIYYKAICLQKLGNSAQATQLFKSANREGKLGNTINEDNAVYELYPYQIRW